MEQPRAGTCPEVLLTASPGMLFAPLDAMDPRGGRKFVLAAQMLITWPEHPDFLHLAQHF